MSEIFPGIEYHFIRAYDTDCHVHLIDLTRVRVQVHGGTSFRYVDDAAVAAGAQLAHNGGGWNEQTFEANEVWVSDGLVRNARPLDSRPFIAFDEDGQFLKFDWGDRPGLGGVYNAFGFDRFLGTDGVFNRAIDDRTTRDPRTACGICEDGWYIVVVADGRSGNNAGLTFPELWEVMTRFNVRTAGNADGGGSSAVYRQDIGNVNTPSERRAVINPVLFFAEGGNGEEPEEGKQYRVIGDTRRRPEPTMDSAGFGDNLEHDSIVVGVDVAQDSDYSAWMVKVPGGWVAAYYKGSELLEPLDGEAPWRETVDPEPYPDVIWPDYYTATITHPETGEKITQRYFPHDANDS